MQGWILDKTINFVWSTLAIVRLWDGENYLDTPWLVNICSLKVSKAQAMESHPKLKSSNQ